MKIDKVFSHPKSPDFPSGKNITTHTNGVISKAVNRYIGPEEYRKYITLIGVFHDIGKLNPNFQKYLFSEGNYLGGYKNHAYLSAVVLLICLYNNQDYFKERYDLILLAISSVLIAKHHGNLPDFENTPLNKDELDKVIDYFKNEKKESTEFLERTNEFLTFYKFQVKQLELNMFQAKIIEKANRLVRDLLTNLSSENKLKYYILSQYIFSCIIEGDKRDAGDNNMYNLTEEQLKFNSEYFNEMLLTFYKQFDNVKSNSLSSIRTLIRDQCVTNIQKQLSLGERVFQLISPTGSGKTLTFMSIANEIKKLNNPNDYKVIYSIPFLSITDQVTQICESIFKDNKNIIRRIDSAGKQINKQKEVDYDPNTYEEDALSYFSDNIFDHAFIITTFVKLFETLTANKNKTLLRLNNFAKSIIILDEIQTLPPRTYTFLVAFLSKFAYLFDAYVIIGSATVPVFELPTGEEKTIKSLNGKSVNINNLFADYRSPVNLLDNYKEIYDNSIFNRYSLEINLNKQTIDELAEEVLKRKSSVMVVLNTKKSSHDLYEKLSSLQNCYLLNTLQTLRDRRMKLDEIKEKLVKREQVLLISTQLIEAGIDISFPYVYRDMCPFPSIIQTAGRCNRNKEIPMGTTMICNLVNNKGKSFHEYVYKDLIDITKSVLSKVSGSINENKLLELQSEFFIQVRDKLEFGKYSLNYTDDNDKTYFLQLAVDQLNFDKLGQFKLIEEQEFDCISVFIIKTIHDKEDWLQYASMKKSKFDFNTKRKLENARKLLSDREVSIPARITNENCSLLQLLKDREVFGLSFLDINTDKEAGLEYTYEKGAVIKIKDSIFI